MSQGFFLVNFYHDLVTMRVPAKKILLFSLLLVCVIVWFVTRGSATSSKSFHQPTVTVKTVPAQQQSMPITVNANGYVTAQNIVDVRPQVQSIVRGVHVREGQNVRQGDLLFTLDDRGAASSVAKAQAQLASQQSDLRDAQVALERNKNLLAQKFVSQSVVDSSMLKVETLRNAVEGARAELQSSHVSLGYHQIRAAISGRIGAITLHPGNLAQPSDVMVNIAQMDPIAVSFTLPERDLAYVVASYPDLNAPVTATLNDGSEVQGKLIFIDNTSDMQSGTIKMKASFPNKDRKLWPGSYVNVRMVIRQLHDVTTIPAQAIVNGPENKFVYVASNDGTAVQQVVTVQAIQNDMAAVTGVKEGARIVIEGMQNLYPGSKIQDPAAKPASATPATATAQH